MDDLDTDRKNVNFIQLNKAYLQQWRKLVSTAPVAAEIMYWFLERMGNDNALVCSYQVLMEVTGASRSTIGRAIGFLKEGNWVDAVKIGNATAYVVNERVAWQTHANKRQYAIFSATVVAAGSEQQDTQPEIKTKLLRVPVVSSRETAIVDNTALPPPDQSELSI